MSADHGSWAAALDEFERRIDGFRQALEPDGQLPDGLWPPSEVVGRPLPPELAERARSLLERARAVEGELVARRTELPAPQRPAIRHRRRPVSSTIYTAL